MKPKVVIAGGGAAGMAVALRLERLGVEPVIVEREERLGGKVRGWHKLFPTFTPAAEILDPLVAQIGRRGIECRTGAAVEALSEHGVKLASGQTIEADAVVVATGFTLFDARRKEEYGYGIYDNVFTTVDIERMLNEGRVAKAGTSADLERMMNEGAVRLADGSTPRRIALLHCVGSRDEKVCQRHCSKVCCITGVKQAIELKKMFPEADVFNFYMDIRMFGAGYEELYREAQQSYNIHFVRGRISEASPMINGRIQIKAEDTLTGRPLRMSIDMLVLLAGMRANDDNAALAASAGLAIAPNGFMQSADPFLGTVRSPRRGIFYAGAVTAPKSLADTLAEASLTADAVMDYLNSVQR